MLEAALDKKLCLEWR